MTEPAAPAPENVRAEPSHEASSWRDVVVGYFDKCYVDYRLGWTDRRSLALHMGYWDRHTRSHADSLLNMNRQLARRSGVNSKVRILDAGCGVGGTTLWLAASFGAEVVGINIAPWQVEMAQRNAQRRRLTERVSFVCRDFNETKLPDESFDIVWAQEAVAHAAEKEAFFHEAFRVLRPGGRLVMEEGLRFARPYEPHQERLLQLWLPGWAVPDLATGDEYEAWSRNAGFDDVGLDDVTEHVRPSLRRLYRRSAAIYPLASLRHPVRRLTAWLQGAPGGIDDGPLDRDRRLRNLRGGLYQWRALEEGLWFLGILTATKPG